MSPVIPLSSRLPDGRPLFRTAPAAPAAEPVVANSVLQRMVDERQGCFDSIDQINAAADAEARDPSEAESQLLERHAARIAALEPQIATQVGLEEARRRHASLSIVTRQRPAAPASSFEPDPPGRGVVVYRTFGQYAQDALVRRFDHLRQAAGPAFADAASARLERVVANTITSDVAGLVPPQHIDQIMQQISRDRPVVSISRRVPLTSGTLTYPRITGAPTVGKQAAEKTEGASTKMQVAMVSKVAGTYLGSGDLSWQTIQWSTPDALTLWFDLCAESYAGQTELDACTTLGTVTAATPVAADDLAGWMAAIAEAAGIVYMATKRNAAVGRRVNAVVFDAATGYHLFGIVSAQNPIFLATGQANLAAGTGPPIGGLAFVITGQLPTGTVIVGDYTALLCSETAGAPVEMRAVEPSIGGLEVGLIGAFASDLIEPAAFCKLTAPPPLVARLTAAADAAAAAADAAAEDPAKAAAATKK